MARTCWSRKSAALSLSRGALLALCCVDFFFSEASGDDEGPEVKEKQSDSTPLSRGDLDVALRRASIQLATQLENFAVNQERNKFPRGWSFELARKKKKGKLNKCVSCLVRLLFTASAGASILSRLLLKAMQLIAF